MAEADGHLSGEEPAGQIYVLVASVLTLLIGSGAMFLVVVALKPIAAEFSWPRQVPSLAFSLQFLGAGFGGFFMGRVLDRYGMGPPAHRRRADDSVRRHPVEPVRGSLATLRDLRADDRVLRHRRAGRPGDGEHRALVCPPPWDGGRHRGRRSGAGGHHVAADLHPGDGGPWLAHHGAGLRRRRSGLPAAARIRAAGEARKPRFREDGNVSAASERAERRDRLSARR